MKSIKRIRLSLVTAFSAAAIALTAVGLNMRPVSVKAENSVVNGWNSAVARGDQTVDLGTKADDCYASFTQLQSGDVISYNGTLKSMYSEALGKSMPYAMSIIPTGTGTVTWSLTAEGLAAPLSITMVVDGTSPALKEEGAVFGVKGKTCASGETLTVVSDGHYKVVSFLRYMNADGTFEEASMLNAMALYDEATLLYDTFNVSVTVSGEITGLKVKLGESLQFTGNAGNMHWGEGGGLVWDFEGYEAPFNADLGAENSDAGFRGIYVPKDTSKYFAFKGFPLSVKFASSEAGAYPDVRVGGNLIGSDGTAPEGQYGWYRYTLPADATDASISIKKGVNGWNPTVTRGEQQVKADVTMTDDYFTKYTDLKAGDVISYNGKLVSDTPQGRLRTMPYRFAMKATGTGTVTWWFKKDNAALFALVTEIGGKAIGGTYSDSANRTYNSGDLLDIIVDGHHMFGTKAYYVDANGNLSALSGFNTQFWYDAGMPEEFDVSVEITGDLSELQLKMATASEFTAVKTDVNPYVWKGYNAPFTALSAQEAYRGILSPGENESCKSYWAFKGFPVSFKFGTTDAEATPYVTVGGQKVNSDDTADGYLECGWYNYTISPYAVSTALEIKASDLNVTYMDGDEVFKKVAVGFNETTSQLANVEKKGNVAEGFYADADLTTPFDFTSLITQNTNIYIKWKEVPHLTFMVDDQVYGYQNFETAGLPDMPEDPSKEGKGFMGWYADANGTTKFDFSAQITENATAYAVFGYNVAYQISGFTGANQQKIAVVKEGSTIAAADAPSYAEVTGGLEFDAFVLEWYKDAELTQKVTFPYTPSASGALYGRLVDTKDYVKPNEYGWDTQKGVKNQDTVVGDKEIPLTESEYGMAAKAIGQGDGYSKFQLGYEGYVVNANKLNVAKEIYFDIEVDSACDTDWAQSGGAAKWISFGLFNSLNGALTSQGPETNRGLNGGLALFAFNLTENTTQISGWPTGKTSVRPVANAFTYNATVKLDMMHFVIVIGETKAESGLYLEKDGSRTLITNLDLQRSMFPDGAYLMLSCFRKTDFTVRLAQQSSIKAGSQENGTYSFSKTSGIAGEKVYIENIAPKTGYKFSERSVFAGGTALSLETETVGDVEKYYFSMPVGDDVVIEIKWAVAVTFVADDQTLGTAYVVPGDKVLGVDMPDDPEKAGHTFEGWYKDAAFTQEFDRKTDAIEGLTTIYAKFTANAYTITFKSDNETYKTGTANYGGKFTSEEISKEGYTFGGWFTDEACTQAYDFETAVTGDLTVYAKWTAVGGGTSSEEENSSSGSSQNGQSSSESTAGCKAGCGSAIGIGGLISGMTLAGVAILSAFKKKSK